MSAHPHPHGRGASGGQRELLLCLGLTFAMMLVELNAGLRSGSLYDPFPEELNRQSIGRVASWHFAPTPQATHNLRLENVDPGNIFEVGNTVVDATRWAMDYLDAQPDAGASTLPDALAIALDLESESSTQAMIAATVAHFGRLDILHNNAALLGPDIALMIDFNQSLDPAEATRRIERLARTHR